MKKIVSHRFLFGLSSVVFLAAGPLAMAASTSELKACKMAVLEKSKFHDLPMASVSVYPGKNKHQAHYTVRWDGLKADGNCKLSGDGNVKKVVVNNFHDGRTGNSGGGDWNKSNDLDGFYYDRHVGQWRDPTGRTCHTCTPENGFPDHSRRYDDDYRPKNDFERDMMSDLRNNLSDDDIRALNSLN